MTNTNHRELALIYHRRLPATIKAFLNIQGIHDLVIHRYRLGWNDERITIPITNRNREVPFFRLAKGPLDAPIGTQVISSAGAYTELYGWERLAASRDELVICDGEFERLVLESRYIPAVTCTTGPERFREEWGPAFAGIPKVFVCFHNDEAGRASARRVASFIPQCRIAYLPEGVGLGGTIQDFFLRLGKSREDFIALLESSDEDSGAAVGARPRAVA